ncbi:DUF1330 domain-containing protein [Flavivirga jejuensis]|uniref:DUF1330 domain-containing protein n=1 Tax=Flavivirga jejuensis TaxID=870487 RepID=A0ABT8WJ58_9FLAO|nr:DUF1330 domain-containing protein [Flavivirga jejuensis]MDO5973162.1 DUF1330 domain-containing protein [Flavivirga jejuensis]
MRKGYIIESYEIINKEDYIPPVKVINKILEKFYGKFIVATPKSETLKGTPLEVIIVMEFDSEDHAKAFYNSPDYSDYKKLHERTTEGWILFSPEYQKK